jgi:hypothetical protein
MLLQLHDAIDGLVEEGPVVADDDHAAGQPVEEAFQSVQAREVEVVGGLVEQEHVEAGQQDGSERGPGGLAAGQRSHRDVQAVDGQAHVGADLGGAGLQVVAAQGQEVFEGGRVVVQRIRVVGQPLGEAVELVAGLGHARAPSQVGEKRLALQGVGLLGQIAHGETGGGPLDATFVRLLQARQNP